MCVTNNIWSQIILIPEMANMAKLKFKKKKKKHKTYPERDISSTQASALASSLTDPSTLQMLKVKTKIFINIEHQL